MAQQTAVNFLLKSLKIEDLVEKEQLKFIQHICEEAKQMEKYQIIKAHGKKINGGFRSNGDFFQEEITGEEYYNKTYVQ